MLFFFFLLFATDDRGSVPTLSSQTAVVFFFIFSVGLISLYKVHVLICVNRLVAIQFFAFSYFFIVSHTSGNQTVNGTAQIRQEAEFRPFFRGFCTGLTTEEDNYCRFCTKAYRHNCCLYDSKFYTTS